MYPKFVSVYGRPRTPNSRRTCILDDGSIFAATKSNACWCMSGRCMWWLDATCGPQYRWRNVVEWYSEIEGGTTRIEWTHGRSHTQSCHRLAIDRLDPIAPRHTTVFPYLEKNNIRSRTPFPPTWTVNGSWETRYSCAKSRKIEREYPFFSMQRVLIHLYCHLYLFHQYPMLTWMKG